MQGRDPGCGGKVGAEVREALTLARRGRGGGGRGGGREGGAGPFSTFSTSLEASALRTSEQIQKFGNSKVF